VSYVIELFVSAVSQVNRWRVCGHIAARAKENGALWVGET
jgi:hypothetical protein